MLVLSRKTHETIGIDDSVRVTVVEVRGEKVRLGVEAPKDIGVHREEVWLSMKNESNRTEPGALPGSSGPACE